MPLSNLNLTKNMNPVMEANAWILAVLGAGLGIAVLTDMTRHRIPNWLTVSTALLCLLLQVGSAQWNGLLLGIGGLLVGLLCFMPSYLFGAMGAGDVKLMAAVGAALGPWNTSVAVVLTIISGGAIALAYIGLRGGIGAMLQRYGCMFSLLRQQQPQYIPPASDEAAARRIPYALAITCGTVLSVWMVSGQLK